MSIILDGDTGVSTLQNHEQITVDSSGNVGSGTTNPQYHFHANDDVLATSGVTSGSQYVINYAYASGWTYDIANPSVSHTVGTANATPLHLRTNSIDRLKIDSAGRVNMPYQPHVYLRANGHIYATTANTWEQITTAGTFSVESSVGSEWDNTTNRYTVQKAGTYRITVNHLSKDQAHSRVLINGVDNGQSHSRQGETGYCATSGINFLKYLNAGDYIEFGKYISSAGYIYNHPYSHFTISLEK
jgi:hypothetical protein